MKRLDPGNCNRNHREARRIFLAEEEAGGSFVIHLQALSCSL